MNEFTNEEKERINKLYGNDFKDIKPEDAELIGRWERMKAQEEEEHRAKLEALEAETKEKLENVKRQAAYAMESLKIKRDNAKARLERIENGKA